MKNIIFIGLHDLRRFMRDRASYIWLFVMPLVFVSVMSFAARGKGGPEDARPSLVVDNQDAGFMGRVFLRELGEQGLNLVTAENSDNARRGITLPADMTTRILAREEVSLSLFTIEGTDDNMGEIVKLRLFRAIIAINTRLARHAIEHPGAPLAEESLMALIDAPPAVALQSSHAGRLPHPVSFSFSLPGNLVAYVFLNLLIFGGAAVADQRRSGVMRRLAIQPLRKTELLFGKIFGLVLLASVQVAVMLLAGRFLFGVNVGTNLPGIFAVMLVFAWVAASVGVLIGFLVKAEDKVIGLCLAIALPVAALGGCWWPLETAPPIFRHLALAVPSGWALDALHQLITFGAGFEAIVVPVLVIAAFGLAANLAAARFFRV